MCVTIIGKIVEVKGKKAVALVDGEKRVLDLGLVSAVKGDFVSCALNLAVEKLDPAEAQEILDARKGLLEGK